MERFTEFLEQTGFNWIAVLAMAIFGYLIVGNLIRQLKVALLASSMDNALVGFVLTFVRFALLLALLLLCLSTLGIPLSGVVGAISAATLAIGLAVKDILSSVANGNIMFFNVQIFSQMSLDMVLLYTNIFQTFISLVSIKFR